MGAVTPVIRRRRDVKTARLHQASQRRTACWPAGAAGWTQHAPGRRSPHRGLRPEHLKAAARSPLRPAARALRASCRAGSSCRRSSPTGFCAVWSPAAGAVAPWASIRSRFERRTRTRRAPTRTERSSPLSIQFFRTPPRQTETYPERMVGRLSASFSAWLTAGRATHRPCLDDSPGGGIRGKPRSHHVMPAGGRLQPACREGAKSGCPRTLT